MKLSPREQQLDEVLDTLKPLLEKEMDESNRAAIRKALGPIQGEQHYSHYVPPTGKTLASGARPLLEAMIAALPKRHVVAIERETADALIEKYPAWWNKGIDMDSAIEVLPRKKLCLVRARNGRRVIITSSYFVAFAQDVSVNHRYQSVRDFCVCQDLLLASGNITLEAVTKQRKILCSFLMGLKPNGIDKDGNVKLSYRTPRHLAFPQGYFLGNKKHVCVVSQQLEIGYMEMLYLRFRLGKGLNDNLLIAHDLLLNGKQSSSPLEPGFACPGIPACGGYGAQACTGCDDDPYMSMVGADIPDHVMHGYFLCRLCHRKIDTRELAILRQRKNKNDDHDDDDGDHVHNYNTLSVAQERRLQVLEDRAEKHPQQTKASRDKAMRLTVRKLWLEMNACTN